MSISASIIDETSGLFSRDYFEQRLCEEVSRAQRYDVPMSFLIMQLDNQDELKNTLENDGFEKIVRNIGEIIRKEIRHSDILAKMDEASFGLLLVHTDPQGAKVLAKRLKKIIRENTGESISIVIMDGCGDDSGAMLLEKAEYMMDGLQLDGGNILLVAN